MDFTNVITLLGGVALFLFGMSFMAGGLEKMSGGRLERILERMTSNVFKGVLLGTMVTALIQSSSATTVMVVGFVNAGIMKLAQTVGIIMGANIGTTATSLILGMNDIDSGFFLLRLLKPSSLAPIISVIGVMLYMFSSRGGKKNIAGQIFLGFGVLFFGMLTMETAVAPLKDIPEFADILMRFTNPLLGLLAGMLLTAIIQSSSASVGILQALSTTGAIPFSAAAPIILGQNIGTCVTALISGIGASKNAKRAALIHLYFNIIGTVIFLIGIYAVQAVFTLPFWDDIVNRSMIASFHLVFNIGSTLVLLPFSKGILWLATKSLRETGEREDEGPASGVLDERFLTSPSVALARAHDAVVHMGRLASLNFSDSVLLLENCDEKITERIKTRENDLDILEVAIEHYLLKLTDRELTDRENMLHMQLLHSTGDVERIGDYAINIAEAAQEKSKLGTSFSGSALKELKAISSAVEEILNLTIDSYIHDEVEEANRIEPIEQVIDLMTEMLKTRHIARLKKGNCQTEAGALFLELLINFERIADHCSNIALYVIQANISSGQAGFFDSHEYVRKLHQGKKDEYNRVFAEYESTYLEPLRKIEI